MTYPVAFRRQVLSVREKEKLTFDQVSVRFGVGRASVTRWAKELSPKTYVRTKRKIDLEKLRTDVTTQPDAFQYERAARFGVAVSSMNAALKQIGMTVKKSPAPPKS